MKDQLSTASSSSTKTSPEVMAFPVFGIMPPSSLNPHEVTVIVQGGMTLRDYFAACALMYVYHDHEQNHAPVYKSLVAHACYQMADAMLEARNHGA